MTSIRDQVSQHNENALLVDGFDDAIIGIAERCGQPSLAVYDIIKCIEILMERDGMTEEEAYDYFSFNTLGAWVGEHTPLFMWPREPNNDDQS